VISAPKSESAPKGYILSHVKQLTPPITRCCRHPNHAGSGRADLSHVEIAIASGEDGSLVDRVVGLWLVGTVNLGSADWRKGR
jgi:hypothetical protein